MSDWETFEVTEEDIVPRKRKRPTKEEALYGVFYDAEESPKDLHKEVSFTSGAKLESGADRATPKGQQLEEESQLEAKTLEGMYGKGFKMLQKAGFRVGQGLGKNEQGLVAPLQLQSRRKNEGLHLDKGSKEAKVVSTAAPDTKKWKKTYTRPLISKRHIGDLEKLLTEYSGNTEEVHSSQTYWQGTTQKLSLEDAWKRCRQEVVETERQIRYQQDVLIAVSYEMTQTKQGLSRKMMTLSQLADLTDYVSGRLDATLDLPALLQLFQTVKSRFPELWEDLDVQKRVAVPMALKHFSAVWQSWSVSGNPLALREEARVWTRWLGDAAAPLYCEWERSLQRFIQTQWRPREEAGAFIDAVEAWKDVIPSETMSRVKGCLIDVLRTELGKWEPTKETVPVHLWVQPWLGILDLQELWPQLMSKFARALALWHPADESAFVLLSPWKQVVGKLWEPFCTRHILPKLAHALSEIEINPRDQDINIFMKIMDWAEVIPERQFSEILRADFYAKWRETLSTWLANISEESLDEVQLWCENWQSLVPKRLLDFSEAFHSA